MKPLVRVIIVTLLGCCVVQGQVISEPDNVTVCEGKEAVFTCVLNTTNNNMNSDDVQWYRLVKDTGITEMVDQQDSNIHFTTSTINNTLTSQLTITSEVISHTGYYWVGTPSFNACNASLTVLTSPPALTVNVMKNIENLSIFVQWDAVDDSLPITYIVTWHNESGHLIKAPTIKEQTSYTITGLTLDTVYTIIVNAFNRCGDGPEFATSISFPADTTSSTSSISPTVTASTNPMTIMSTANPNIATTIDVTSTGTTTTTATSNATATTSTMQLNTTTTIVKINPSTTAAPTTADTTTADDTGHSSVYIIVGVIIGVVIVVTLLFIMFCCFWKRKGESNEKNEYSNLIGNGTPNKDIPTVPKPLNANEDKKPDKLEAETAQQTAKGAYMMSDVGNKFGSSSFSQPLDPTDTYDKLVSPQPLNPVNACDKLPSPIKEKMDSEQQQQGAMEYAVVDTSKKKRKENEQQNKKMDSEQQQQGAMEYAVVDTSKKKQKRDEQQNVDDAHKDTEDDAHHRDVPTDTVPCNDEHTSDAANQNADDSVLHYAVLQTLPPPTDAYIANDDHSCTPYALLV